VAQNPPTGTINCLALNTKGEMSGVTTTSGLAWKIPGRVGDSPIIGAGLYVDQDVGAAGSTGRGEENIRVAGAHTIVENMRRGMPPEGGVSRLHEAHRAQLQRRPEGSSTCSTSTSMPCARTALTPARRCGAGGNGAAIGRRRNSR
jgi:isoaspartyl peptidase/L-asparaginase-like protein (Ntn-hydrolase superfamily)